MPNIAKLILEGDFAAAKDAILERLAAHKECKLEVIRESVAKTLAPLLTEKNRWKIVRVRIRRGKIQRRRRVSQIKGWTIRGRAGKGTDTRRLVRMTSRERIRRKIGARRAKYKRKAKMSRIRIKYQRALRRRRGLGV